MIARAVDPIIPATITRLKKESQTQWTLPFVATPIDRSSPSNGLFALTGADADSDPYSNHIPVLGSWDENLNPSPCNVKSSAYRSGTQLIRSHSSARISFQLSGNSS